MCKLGRFVFVLQDVNFIHEYNKNPLVLVTAKHSSGGSNALPECNGIVSWIEVNIYIVNTRILLKRGISFMKAILKYMFVLLQCLARK